MQEADSLPAAVADSAAIEAADTAGLVDSLIVPSFPLFPEPASAEPGVLARWDLSDLLNTGSLTFGDLIERVPFLTPIRAGFLEGPQAEVFAGSGSAGLRASLDGYQLVPLFGGPLDTHLISLTELQEVRLIREPGGTHAALQTYRRDRPEAYSRIAGGTGDRRANLFRGYLSSQLSSMLFTFSFDRVDTRGDPILGSSRRTVVDASIAHQLPAGLWGQLETRLTSTERDSFPSPRQTDWIVRLRRSFGDEWHADLVGGSSSLTEQQDVPFGQPDSLFPDREASARQLGLRAAYSSGRVISYGSVRLWDGDGVPSFEPELSLEVALGPAQVFASGQYADWGSFNTAGGYAALQIQLPLGLRAMVEAEEGDRGLYNAVPVRLEEFSRWTAGAELEVGGLTLGGRGGRWRVGPSPSLGQPYDEGTTLPGGTVGVVEVFASAPVVRLLGGDVFLGGRYRNREPGFFLYWPQTDWRLEGEYILRKAEGQLEIILRGVGGVRGPMRVPDEGLGEDQFRLTENLGWLWSEAIIRVKDVHLFLTYEVFDSPGGPSDIPGMPLPRARTHFGLKWEFWN